MLNAHSPAQSRVVIQAKTERNFHSFFQLLASGDYELLDKLKLTDNPDDYYYLNQSGCVTVDSINDKVWDS